MSAVDITRFLDKPRKHYAGGRMQQGRVLLDSDFNETAALHEGDQTQALVDLIGGRGSPDRGFEIDQQNGSKFQPGVTLAARPPVELNGVETAVRVVSIHEG